MMNLNRMLPLAFFAAATCAGAQTAVSSSAFGTLPEGGAVTAYTLKDAQLTVRVITFGAHIISIDAPDRDGKKADVVLGYRTLAGYLADTSSYMGSVVGRYGNRIAHADFKLDGKDYPLSANEHGNTLHGGVSGFDRKNWTGKQIPNGVELTLVSPDGDMGFPGTLTAHVRYTLVANKLHVDYSATTTKPTVINLTQHSYFNLGGSDRSDINTILGETMMIRGSRFTPVDNALIPTGELAPVASTPFDFTSPTPIGARIHDNNGQLKLGKGYDHNWVLDKPGLAQVAAEVTDPATGRVLKVSTTEPGVQFYAGTSLNGSLHSDTGATYAQFDGLCLETQHFPDSPNHPAFPTTTLQPGQTYKTTTVFEFTTTR